MKFITDLLPGKTYRFVAKTPEISAANNFEQLINTSVAINKYDLLITSVGHGKFELRRFYEGFSRTYDADSLLCKFTTQRTTSDLVEVSPQLFWLHSPFNIIALVLIILIFLNEAISSPASPNLAGWAIVIGLIVATPLYSAFQISNLLRNFRQMTAGFLAEQEIA